VLLSSTHQASVGILCTSYLVRMNVLITYYNDCYERALSMYWSLNEDSSYKPCYNMHTWLLTEIITNLLMHEHLVTRKQESST